MRIVWSFDSNSLWIKDDFILSFMEASLDAFLQRIKPEFTGKKYGEIIVNHLEQVIKEKNFRNIIASISSDNTFSIILQTKD